MDAFPSFIYRYFRIVANGRAYLSAIYLLLAFPLGLAYFIFLVVGLSVGIGLSIIWVGIPIILLVFAGWVLLVAFERGLANWLLGEKIPPPAMPEAQQVGTWERIRSILRSPSTWLGLIYLLAKFPLGVLTFVISVTLITVTLGFISAPLTYNFASISYGFGQVDSLSEASIIALVGILLLPLSLHAMRWIGWLHGRFAFVMLGDRSQLQSSEPRDTLPLETLEDSTAP